MYSQRPGDSPRRDASPEVWVEREEPLSMEDVVDRVRENRQYYTVAHGDEPYIPLEFAVGGRNDT